MNRKGSVAIIVVALIALMVIAGVEIWYLDHNNPSISSATIASTTPAQSTNIPIATSSMQTSSPTVAKKIVVSQPTEPKVSTNQIPTATNTQPSLGAETIGVYSNETYTDGNLGLQIKATDFPNYAFTGTVTKNGQTEVISMTLGQAVPIFNYIITLKSISTQNSGYVNGQPVTSNYATFTIATQ